MRVKTFVIRKDVAWKDGKLRLEFEGNRVDVVYTVVYTNVQTDKTEPAAVAIDDKKPSEISELYGFTRALSKPGSKWPPIAPISSEKPLVVEDWTMQVQRDRTSYSLSN